MGNTMHDLIFAITIVICLKLLFTICLESRVCNYRKGDCELGIGYKVMRKRRNSVI
jgi:uncharacterized membrane protein